MTAYVYIITNKPNGVLYIGVTTDIVRRIHEHCTGMISGFSKKYNLHHLVFIEETYAVEDAIKREKQIKNWHRNWKINLIEAQNPEWRDLYQL